MKSAKPTDLPCRKLSGADKILKKFVKAPETAVHIYELAESLFMRETCAQMSLADIERIHRYLRQTDADAETMGKQLRDLSLIENSFCSKQIPIGF